MRVESSITVVTWLPSEAVEGFAKLPYGLGLARYDDPPPDDVADLRGGSYRFLNALHAWSDFEAGTHGVDEADAEFESGGGWRRFRRTVREPVGLPIPRRVLAKPFVQVAAPAAWTTVELTLHSDGRSEGRLVGASSFPRHWVYGADGRLVQKSGAIDFEAWFREEGDAPALVSDPERDFERVLSRELMTGGASLERRRLDPGEALVEQAADGRDLFLILDGVLDVDVDGEVVAQIGPGTIIGELASLDGGRRTATLRAVSVVRAVVIPGGTVSQDVLERLAAGRGREDA